MVWARGPKTRKTRAYHLDSKKMIQHIFRGRRPTPVDSRTQSVRKITLAERSHKESEDPETIERISQVSQVFYIQFAAELV